MLRAAYEILKQVDAPQARSWCAEYLNSLRCRMLPNPKARVQCHHSLHYQMDSCESEGCKTIKMKFNIGSPVGSKHYFDHSQDVDCLKYGCKEHT